MTGLGFAALAALLLAPPAFAARGDSLIECVDADGNARFTNRSCKKNETEVVPKAIPEPPRPKTPAPPGVMADREGVAVRAPGKARTVYSVLSKFRWDAKRKTWKRKGRVGKREREALHNAIAAFNMTRELSLNLVEKETDEESFSIGEPWKHRNRFVVYWADDAKPGALPDPFRVRNGANFGGCSVVVENPDGSHAWAVDGRVEPGAKIVGAALFMVEFSRRVRKSFSCEGKGARYELLHQLGHCLGLTHATPSPSIMGGTCGEDYYPNDILNFKTLYGN